jgi:hypothetical protein
MKIYTITQVAEFGKYLFSQARKEMILEAFKNDLTKSDTEKVYNLYKADIENFIISANNLDNNLNKENGQDNESDNSGNTTNQ